MFRWVVCASVALLISTATGAAEPYKRSLYKHWVDADGNCRNTRQEVLIAESAVPVDLDARGCTVLTGQWNDPYTAKVFTNPKKLDIDHFIPLKEVHRSGGSRWGAARRQAYANDLDSTNTLIAVDASANRAKGDKDPAKWMPRNAAFHCDYVRIWVDVKERWRLTMDAAEKTKIQSVLTDCPPSLFSVRRFFDPFRILSP